MKRASHSSNQGFTIVELLIVIVVIAILAAITIVSYNGIQRRAIAAVQQNDLKSVSRQLEILRADNAYSYKNPSLWKQAIVNAKLYDALTVGTVTAKSMLVCSTDDHYALGGWAPFNDLEVNAVDAYYIFDGSLLRFNWNTATAGASTLAKFCAQVSAIHGVDVGSASGPFRSWMHTSTIRDAPPL